MIAFCWLPPLRLVMGVVRSGVFTPKLLDCAPGQGPFAAAIEPAEAGHFFQACRG